MGRLRIFKHAVNRLGALWHWLTMPSPAIHEPGERRQVQLLSSLLVLLLVISILLGASSVSLAPYDDRADTAVRLSVASTTLFAFLYALSRTRFYRLVALLTVVISSVSAFILSAPVAGATEPSLLVYLVIPVLLSSFLLSIRVTTLVIVMQLAAMFVLHQSAAATAFQDKWIEFVLAASALILLITYQRSLMERDRQVELAASEARYRAVSELSSDYAYAIRVEADGSFQSEWFTEAFRRITGYDWNDLVTRTGWISLVHPDDHALVEARIDLLLTGQPDTSEYRIMTRQGEVRWLRDSSRPVWDAVLGRVVGIYGAAQDITAHKAVEMRLAAEHTLLRTVIDHLPDHIYAKDTDHRFILHNSALAEWAGMEDLLGKTDFDCFPPEVAAQRQAVEQAIIQTGQATINCEESAPDGKGGLEWLLTTRIPLRDRQSRIVGLVGIGRDITMRKQSEDALARYARRLDALHALDQSVLAGEPPEHIAVQALQNICHLIPFQMASVVRFDNTLDHARVLADQGDGFVPGDLIPASYFKTTGAELPLDQYTVDDLGAQSEHCLLHEKLLAAGIHACLHTPLIVEGKLIGALTLGAREASSFNSEHTIIAWELANELAIAIHHAELRAQLASYTVRLEERVAQRTAELDRVTDRVEAILNNSSDAIVLVYPDGAINQTNLSFDRLFGYMADEVFRQPLTTIVHPDDAEALCTVLQTVVTTGEVQQLEVVARRKDGSIFHAEVGLAFLKGAHGPRDGIVCTLRDITDHKHAQAELLNALEQEKELSELKSRFVSMASHEFRTPLTTIVASTEMLERYTDKMDSAQKQKHFDKIYTAARHMTQLLEDVLTLGRAEAGQMELQPVDLDLEKLCRELLEEVQLGANPLLQFTFTSAGVCQDVYLDPTLIHNAIGNLLANAVKYSPNGGTIHLDLRCEAGQIVIRVADQGIGIPPKDQERLFEPFHRAQNVGTIQGTGLGLTITQRAIALHGGTIALESAVGAGSTFTVTLPNRQI